MLSSDYSRIDLPVVEWGTIDIFLRDLTLDDAINSIALPSGHRLEIVHRGLRDAGDLAAVPMYFSGALPHREETRPPYFSGERMSAALGMPWIAVSDPVLSESDDFPLAWYTGRSGDSVQSSVARIADALSERLSREILFVGGSGGGFASLITLALSSRPARALVWNSQWDIRRYVKETVRDYMVKGLGMAVEDGSVTDAEEPAELLWKVPRIGDDKTLVYLQNLGDWHVKDHLLGFLQDQDFQDASNGVYERSALQVFIANYGVGHAVPPQNILHRLIEQLTGSATSKQNLIAAAENAGLWDHTAPPALPRLELAEAGSGGTELSIDLSEQGGGSRVHLQLTGMHASRGWPSDVLYNVSGRDVDGNRVGAGAQHRPVITFPNRRLHSVYATARDGFGRLICDGTARAADLPVAVGARQRANGAVGVFIIGSCVSRDAFNLPGVPDIADYVARSSFASSFEPVPDREMPDLEKNPSKFQQRMVQGDWQKTLERKLFEHRDGIVLVDLIDERFSQIHVGGSVVTGSPELQRCDADLFRLVRDAPGSDAHVRRFRRGFQRFTEVVDPGNILVSKVFWAHVKEDGELLPDQQRIAEANSGLRRLYRIVSEFPVRWIEYPSNLLVASAGHRWGAAPFHYADPFYERTIASIFDAFEDEYMAR
ncbi:DUF6270 domain-containing protein [uncultured Brachybacterium sp.]|uniref:DUF6270 domain-containing protein n=1 Tax=uncultured Brachybacterium sp. TaxID=189680 RepID=UPI002622A03D|nr:DUF6270 domain-containing protein [uncultured Brachybacterium sp.]